MRCINNIIFGFRESLENRDPLVVVATVDPLGLLDPLDLLDLLESPEERSVLTC